MPIIIRRSHPLSITLPWSIATAVVCGISIVMLFLIPGTCVTSALADIVIGDRHVASFIAVLTAALLHSRYVLFACPESRATFLHVTCFIAAITFVIWLSNVILRNAGHLIDSQIFLVAALACVFIGTAGGVAILLVRWLLTFLGYSFIVHADNICCNCGYIIDNANSLPHCSECGQSVRSAVRRTILDRVAKRHVYTMFPLAVIALWVIASVAVNNHRSTAMVEFSRLAPASSQQVVGQMFETFQTGSGLVLLGDAWESQGVWKAVSGTPYVLMIYYEPSPQTKQPSMQIRVGTLIVAPSGTSLPVDGDPYIICDLDQEAAKMVIANGVSPELEDLLVSTANRNAWTPPVMGTPPSKPIVLVHVTDVTAPK